MTCTAYMLGFGPIPAGNVPVGSFPQFWICDAEIDLPLSFCAGSMAFCISEGTNWRALVTNAWTKAPNKRVEVYNGTTDASGNYAVTFPLAFSITPHINPACTPPADSITRARLTASSNTGFTVKTERNATVNLLGIDILGIGTANVITTPVSVLVVER